MARPPGCVGRHPRGMAGPCRTHQDRPVPAPGVAADLVAALRRSTPVHLPRGPARPAVGGRDAVRARAAVVRPGAVLGGPAGMRGPACDDPALAGGAGVPAGHVRRGHRPPAAPARRARRQLHPGVRGGRPRARAAQRRRRPPPPGPARPRRRPSCGGGPAAHLRGVPATDLGQPAQPVPPAAQATGGRGRHDQRLHRAHRRADGRVRRVPQRPLARARLRRPLRGLAGRRRLLPRVGGTHRRGRPAAGGPPARHPW